MHQLSQHEGFVFYQKPNSNEICFFSGKWKKIELNKTPNLQGFIISNADKSSTYLLAGEAKIISSEYQIDLNISSPQLIELEKEPYLKKAKLFVDACTNNLDKVVLSRIKKHTTTKESSIFKTFLNLCSSYNHSFNYLFNIPNIGAWMGASPEVLINGKNKNYTSVALAGSMPSGNSDWKQKEIDEQQFVTNYISEKFNQASIAFKFNKTPETIEAGNISHLKTTFNITTEKAPLELANLLHPTPAICGLPQKQAQNFILNNEGYDRQFYTGFLGAIGPADCNLYVNLRCMQIFKGEQWLYVGGGITSDSNIESEWEETELKAQTLLNILD